MAKATKLTSDGQTIAHRVGAVLVVLTCVRPNLAYRVAVQYGSTGAEIDGLCASYPSETAARSVARSACAAFASGASVYAVLAGLNLAPKAVEA